MPETNSCHTPNKRKRVGEVSELRIPVPVPSTTRSDIWLEDGNIIIQAETTQFKVYRGVLSMHSSVFKGMLSTPQPSSEAEGTVEGCPVIYASDSAVDVAIILRALFLRG